MGDKAARQSAAGAAMAERLRDDLAELGSVTTRKMFGGHGVFESDVMFALVDSTGTPYLRADDATAPAFEDAGAQRHGRMPYWRSPHRCSTTTAHSSRGPVGRWASLARRGADGRAEPRGRTPTVARRSATRR